MEERTQLGPNGDEELFKIPTTDTLGDTKLYLLIIYLGLLSQSGTVMTKKKRYKSCCGRNLNII